MFKFSPLSVLICACILFVGCQSQQQVQISGTLDYTGSSEVYISKQPIHYKYAPKKQFPVSTDDNGAFSLSIPVDSTQIIEFTIDDQSYPIVARPGQDLDLSINRSQFPEKVDVSGYPKPWDEYYSTYQQEIQPVRQEIDEKLPAFREGEDTNIPSFYKKRYELAQKHFQDTPLDDIYYHSIGEYLVKKLEKIKYHRTQAGFNPDQKRQEVLSEAKDLEFFTFESLHAQRAGIRDFTNAFANTFGVADSLENKFGQELMQYDVKRLGYDRLDSARTAVLDYIDERKALAYSKIHLIAERIGEMPLDVATPSYKQFLEEFSDFPRYTSFLQTFYKEIERVSPGQPAIPFSLPNKDNEIVQMKDFRGQYVLLDFWASWCIPCLDEFPHMKELYNDFSRENFEIVAISIEEDSLRWRESIQKFDNPWPQLYGGNSFEQETFKAYRGGGIPFYMLIGPDGKIVRYNDIRPSFNLPQVLDSLITQER